MSPELVLKQQQQPSVEHNPCTPMPWMKRLLYQPISQLELLEIHKYYLQEETKICKTVDPWAGSYYVEKSNRRNCRKSLGFN
jgi:hypothetical protein